MSDVQAATHPYLCVGTVANRSMPTYLHFWMEALRACRAPLVWRRTGYNPACMHAPLPGRPSLLLPPAALPMRAA
jgi:hypothetical protein